VNRHAIRAPGSRRTIVLQRWRCFRTTVSVVLGFALAAASCDGRDGAPLDAVDATLVVTDSEYALVGNGVRRGWVRADSLLLEEDLRSGRLIRPALSLIATEARPQPIQIVADSGRLFMVDDRVLLFEPTVVDGANRALIGRDSVWYAPAGDSVWAPPTSGER